MKACGTCEQPNSDDARFCHQCGSPFSAPLQEEAAPLPLEEAQLWRAFIGPNADRYLEQFRKFTTGETPGFAFTWHWPAFLVDPFLWFLYRKMYLYALVYAVGPVVSAYLTGDYAVGIVWRLIAGASANYIYYWHVKEHLAEIRTKGTFDSAARERLLLDLGGVQPYVIWLGVALYALMLALLIEVIREGPPEGKKSQGGGSAGGVLGTRHLPGKPGPKPFEVMLVHRAARLGGGAFLLELSVGARPVLLPPGFELIRGVGRPVRLIDAGGRNHVGDERPIPVFPQA